MHFVRFDGNPIITPRMSRRICEHGHANINGPSLIAAPEWLPGRLGGYYLYFAHHQGTYIRLAYADDLRGPWRIHEPGTLPLDHTPFAGHIASPDVHVDHPNRRIVMYYHGCPNFDEAAPWPQVTCAATSPDGVNFTSRREVLCPLYLRRFDWRGRCYGIAMPGQFYRSDDGLTNFEALEPMITDALCWPTAHQGESRKPRHFAVNVRGDVLRLFFSRTGDCPEHIMMSEVPLGDDWTQWQPTRPVSVVEPETDWEGAGCDRVASRGGAIHEPACQLRDPAVYEEGGRTYLLYSVAGERGIAIGELAEA